MEGNIKQEYLQNIQATEGSSIMTIKTLCLSDSTIHYKENVDKLLNNALHDNFYQEKQQRGRSWRLPDHSKGDTKSNAAIPRFPGHLLDFIRNGNGQQVDGLFLKWKKLWN